ncbi:MAG TPA: hypothetical protein VF528_21730 [Pyrinomonadaceae bacterium]|jgi:hypothetical protein
MRWTIARVAFACFALSIATACGAVVAQQNSNTSVNANYQADVPAANDNEQPVPLEEESDAPAAVRFEKIEVVSTGYANAESIRLRESPESSLAGGRVVKIPENFSFSILDWTRDYLRIRITEEDASLYLDESNKTNLEGWVTWGEVSPVTTAVVLDTESGAVVSRLPFFDNDSTINMSYSSDNSRALFYNNEQAYEVKTEDYTLTRSFKAKLEDTPFSNVSFFYGLTDDSIYAALTTSSAGRTSDELLLNIVRVDDFDGPAPAPLISERAVGFALSPDGSKGFILHAANFMMEEMLVDVLDIRGMRVSNTFTLRGQNLPTSPSEFVTNADGSEFYRVLSPGCDAISVIDTTTGQLLREIPTGEQARERALYLTRQEMVGNSFFFRIWDDEDAQSLGVLLNAEEKSELPRGIDYLVEANGVRFGVNDAGTRLFKLDAENRISKRYRIERPDMRHEQSNDGEDGLIVYQFLASPDGKSLMVVLGFPHDC